MCHDENRSSDGGCGVRSAGTLEGTFAGGESLPGLTGLLSWNVNYDTVGDRVLLEVSSPFSTDFDGDGDVDSDDLFKWQGDYGVDNGSDADGDGDSDGTDFLAWQQQRGSGVSPLASTPAVPEPGSGWLIALALLSVWLTRGGCLPWA